MCKGLPIPHYYIGLVAYYSQDLLPTQSCKKSHILPHQSNFLLMYQAQHHHHHTQPLHWHLLEEMKCMEFVKADILVLHPNYYPYMLFSQIQGG